MGINGCGLQLNQVSGDNPEIYRPEYWRFNEPERLQTKRWVFARPDQMLMHPGRLGGGVVLTVGPPHIPYPCLPGICGDPRLRNEPRAETVG